MILSLIKKLKHAAFHFFKIINRPSPDKEVIKTSRSVGETIASDMLLEKDNSVLNNPVDRTEGYNFNSIPHYNSNSNFPPLGERAHFSREFDRCIGRYNLIRVLGRGGMGVVYEAEDPVLNRHLALKILQGHKNSQASRRRFFREARAIAKLRHPNIITIHEIGADGDNLFISMEILDGMDLNTLLQKGNYISFHEKIRMIIDICSGLSHAHENGIVHRDIKPSNIFITNNRFVKLMDFGIAKIRAETEYLTTTGTLKGTLAYMSPEQIRGEQVDQRSDIFSLGMTMYEFLTGQYPYSASNPDALIYNITSRDPLPFPDLDMENQEILESIVFHAMEKNFDNRYQNVSDLLSDLDKYLNGEKIKKYKSARKRRFERKMFIGSVLSLIIIFLLYFLIHSAIHTERRQPADIVFQEYGILIKDQFGILMGNCYFDLPLSVNKYEQPYKFLYHKIDFDTDGYNDLVFATHHEENNLLKYHEIIFFKNERNHFNKFRKEVLLKLHRGSEIFDERYYVSTILPVISDNGEQRIIAVLRNIASCPGIVWLMNSSGEILSQYLNYGHLHFAMAWDSDGDGKDEICVSGTNNDYDSPIIVVLDPNTFGGTSPVPSDNQAWDPSSVTKGQPRHIIKLDSLIEGDMEVDRSKAILVSNYNGVMKVVVTEGSYTLDYYFKPNFDQIDVRFNSGTYLHYSKLQKIDSGLPELSDREKFYRDNINFWNGNEWVKHPVHVTE